MSKSAKHSYYWSVEYKPANLGLDDLRSITDKIKSFSGSTSVIIGSDENLTKEEMDAIDAYFKNRGFTKAIIRIYEQTEYEKELEG